MTDNLVRPVTVQDAMAYWVREREGSVKKSTLKSYRLFQAYIVGPFLCGTRAQRLNYTRRGRIHPNPEFLPMLGAVRLADLNTAAIRMWHKTLCSHVTVHTANVAKKFLRAALVLCAEDFGTPAPPMPSRVGRGHARPKKRILSTAEVQRLIQSALQDPVKGIYYAFPFLTGVRPSEQLALLWDDVDLVADVIHICRMQEPDGSISTFTKTAAGTRDIPIAPILKQMLQEWRLRCPIRDGDLPRVFPALGKLGAIRHKRRGGALSFTNFIYRYWRPPLLALNLPIVTPHSARHAFISTLQAQGVEVGLVAKLAGHSNITVTLNHYTQAVRGGAAALVALQDAYAPARRSGAP